MRDGGGLQTRLMEQVAARVAGQTQLGENENLDLLLRGPVDEAKDLSCVEGAVGYANQGTRRRHSYEAMMRHVSILAVLPRSHCEIRRLQSAGLGDFRIDSTLRFDLNKWLPAIGEIADVDFRAILIPLEGGLPVEIDKGMVLVGRKDQCDILLDHKSVSKVHCVLVKTDGLLVLRDLGSTNGTRVNGTRVRRAALLPNDKVSFANCHFKVHLGPKDVPVSPSELTMQIREEDIPDLPGKLEAEVKIHRNELPDIYPEKTRRDRVDSHDSEKSEV
jgi:hypothetical protein